MNNHDECEPPSDELIAAGDQKIAAVIQEVLSERFPRHAPYMITNWHVIATLIDTDGDESFVVQAPMDSKSWTILGMLDYAMKHESAQINRRVMED